MEFKEIFSKKDLYEIADVLLRERGKWLRIAYDIEHPYEDKRRKDKSEQVKKRVQLCYARANCYCALSNTVEGIAENLD